MADRNKIEVVLTAVDKGLQAVFNRANATIAAAETGAKSYGRSMDALQTPLRALTGTLARLGAAFGAVFATQQYVQTAEAYAGIDARLRLVTASSQDLAVVQRQLYELSQETGTGYQENAATYTKLSMALKETGVSGKEILKINEAVSKSLVVSGASASDAASFLLQFGQAMGSGVLQGDELRAVLESNGYFAQQLAKALKTDVAGLRQMGSAGKLTAEAIRNAVPAMLKQINEDFSKMPLTIGRAMTMLENAFGKLVNGSNTAGGATGKLAELIRQFVVYLETNGQAIEDMAVKLIGLAGDITRTAWEYRNFIAGFAITSIAVGAVGTLTTAVKGLGAAFAALPVLFRGAFGLIGAFTAGYSLGTWLVKEFSIVKKIGTAMALTFTMIGLQAKKAWAQISGGDVSAVQVEIDKAKQIYRELFDEIGRGSEKASSKQKADQHAVNTAVAESLQKQKELQAAALDSMRKKYQDYAQEIKRLQGELYSAELSLDQKLRDMARTGMSDIDSWRDKKKQAEEYIAVAKAAADAGALAMKNAKTDEDFRGVIELFKTQAEYAKLAEQQYESLGSEVKNGDKILISQADALKLRMAGVKEAGELNIEAIKKMQDVANDANNALTEKSGFKDLSKGMDEAEEKWLKNWQRMRAKAIEEIEEVEDRLVAIKDKEVTVYINEKVKKAVGGIVQRFARGGRLSGYGGGDRIPALLEAGEFIIRKEAVARFGSGLFAALNSLRLPDFSSLPRFATGGPIGATAAPATAAAGAIFNVTLNYSGGGSALDAKRMASMVASEFERQWRNRS